MLFAAVAQAFLSQHIDCVGKGQTSVLVGGELFAEILIPGSISAVHAHASVVVQHLQVFPGDGQSHGNLYPLLFFIKVTFTYPVRAAHRPDSIQNGGFSRIVLPHQNQGVFNVPNLHIPYVFKIPDVKAADLHNKVSFWLLFTANVTGDVFSKGMLRDAKQNPELASAKMQFIAFCVHLPVSLLL